MKRLASISLVAAATLAMGISVAGCGSGESAPTSGASSAESAAADGSAASASPSATFGAGDGLALGGTDVPANWPDEVPTYPSGAVLSAAVLDDGGVINASWATDDDVDTAWQTLDSALRERGYLPLGDLGEESQFIQDETQTTDTYRNDAYEVNVVVVGGDQTTVLLNASRLT